MKRLNKTLQVLLAFALLLILTVPAFAASGSPTEKNCSITIDNSNSDVSIDGTTYSAYKIFSLSYDTDKSAYTYSVDNTCLGVSYTPSGSGTALTGTTLIQWLGDSTSASDIRNFADSVYTTYIQNASPAPAGTAKAIGQTTTINGLTPGYYLVYGTAQGKDDSTTVAASVSLTTAAPDATVQPKLDVPTIDKQVYENAPAGWGKVADYSIGQNVPFKLISTVPSYAPNYNHDYTYIIHDTLDSQMTLNNDILVYSDVDCTSLINSSNYTISTTGIGSETFRISFKSDYIKAHPDKSIYVIYSALLTKDANIYKDKQDNTVYLEYSNNPYTNSTAKTKEHKVHVYTYKFDIFKYYVKDSRIPLADAQFKLYSDSEGKTEIPVILDGTTYRPVVSGETAATAMISGNDGLISIKGLDAGTYYLKETQAPTGFNPVPGYIEVTISHNLDEAAGTSTMTLKNGDLEVGQIEVEDSTGGLLPTTGGIGTTIFYAIGGTLTAGAGIVLIARKRVKNEK